MAKIELKFIDCQMEDDYIKVISAIEGEGSFIAISGKSFGEDFYINLDKSTAIKFAKTLRTEINKIKEVDNG